VTFGEASLRARLIAAAVMFTCGVGSALLGAHVFCELWAWFVVPVTGWPTLSLAGAWGLGLVVLHFAHKFPTPAEEAAVNAQPFATVVARGLVTAPVRYLGLWGFGALAHAVAS
jgi:hypothetical protein